MKIMEYTSFDALIKHKFAIGIHLSYHDNKDLNAEMIDWCKKQFGIRNFTASFFTFYFNSENDRNYFILRWC